MSIGDQVKLANASMLGLFSIYLIARGISPAVIAIPAISCIKYIYLSSDNHASKQNAHYLSWFLTTPIMLWLIFSLNNLSLGSTTLMILLNQLMIVSGYLAASATEEKEVWNWFYLGCFAFLPIVYQLLQFSEGLALVVLTLVTWSTYPVVWWADKKKLISEDTRDVSYSVLDFTSKVGIVLLYLRELKAL